MRVSIGGYLLDIPDGWSIDTFRKEFLTPNGVVFDMNEVLDAGTPTRAQAVIARFRADDQRREAARDFRYGDAAEFDKQVRQIQAELDRDLIVAAAPMTWNDIDRSITPDFKARVDEEKKFDEALREQYRSIAKAREREREAVVESQRSRTLARFEEELKAKAAAEAKKKEAVDQARINLLPEDSFERWVREALSRLHREVLSSRADVLLGVNAARGAAERAQGKADDIDTYVREMRREVNTLSQTVTNLLMELRSFRAEVKTQGVEAQKKQQAEAKRRGRSYFND